MTKNRFLEDALSAADEVYQGHKNEIENISISPEKMEELLPNSSDRAELQILLEKVNSQTSRNNQLKFLEESAITYSKKALEVVKGLLLK